jgi:cytochrome P450
MAEMPEMPDRALNAETAAGLMHFPLDWYRRMRAQEPVAWDAKFGSWNVFRYDDALALLSDHATFSSRVGAPDKGLPSIVGMDEPRHRQLRGLVNQAFTPRIVAELGPRITAVADELLDQVRPRGRFDLIQDFAYPLPIRIIAELLGIPVEEQATFRRWSETLITGPRTDAVRGRSYAQERSDSLRDLNDYFRGKLAERRRSPRQDLMSRLLVAEVDGERLAENDLLEFCRLLLIAGYETTACLIGNTVLALHEHPEVAAEVRADTSLVAGAIEESLRCYPSVAGTMRVATADTIVGGQAIAKGQSLIAWLGSANYDEAHFVEPERFDVRRSPNRHLAFGFGIHFCVGAPLARLEARIAITQLLTRLPGFEREPEAPVEHVESPFIFGVKHFHVRL